MGKMRQFWPVLGAGLTGWAAWGYGLTPLAALFFLIWGASSNRKVAYLAALAYYLAGSRIIPGAASVFFGEDSSLLLGIVLWLSASTLLALPWGLLFTDDRTWRRLPRLLLVLVLVTIPPLGFIGWLNPMLGTALIAPGLGFGSITIGLMIAAWLTLLPVHSPQWRSALAATLIVLVAIVGQPAPKSMPGWVGLQTSDGRFPDEHEARLLRYATIQSHVERYAAEPATKVIVFPEQHLGDFNRDVELGMSHLLQPSILGKGIHLLIGAAYPTGNGKRTSNALLHFDGETWVPIHARFAVPVSMWKPWSDETTEVDPFNLNLIEVASSKIHYSLCYEDYMPWLHLGVLLMNERPDLIVAAANGWWVQKGKAQAIQDEHIRAWARIFDLPLVRALNAS